MADNGTNSEEICCPEFDPKPWDGKILDWNNKKFVKDKVFTMLHIPVNFGGVITKLMKKIKTAGATAPDWMALSDHTSMWNMNLYVAVDKEIPNAENTTISGKFLCKVYEGPYQDTGKWCENFAEYTKSKGLKTGKMYMWYTTCPKCAEKYGKNYVAIISEIS
ncbi:MAG: hydrolase [Candidatus Diapherotrites archaeon]